MSQSTFLKVAKCSFSCRIEMTALATASEETSWLRCLLAKIPLWEKSLLVVLVHCDSTAAIANINDRYYNGNG